MNPRHRAYQLLYQATHALRQHSQHVTLTPKTPSCACCERRWAEVEAPFQAAEYRYGKSGETEYLCLTCYTPRISSEVMLGIERMNITGNTSTEIYGKLGMLVGSGGIVTPQAELYLTLPPKLHEKYQHGEWGQQGRLSTEKPLARLIQLLVQGALAPLEDGFVYIENWGRKADGLMRQLMPTNSLHEVWCNSENGVSVLDLHAIIRTANVMSAQGIEAQAGRLAFWSPILDAAKGRRDEEAFAKGLTKVPDPAALLQALPADPYSRLRLPAVLGILMPYRQQLLPYCETAIPAVAAPNLAKAASHQPEQGTLF